MIPLLFHVQHILGIGHHRRAELLARSLMRAGFAVTVARGGFPVPGEDWGGADIVQLPPCRAETGDLKTLLDADGQPVDDAWRAARRDALLATYRRIGPRVLLLEGFPFARRQFRFELLPLLELAGREAQPPVIATSIRDILVTKPQPKRIAEVVETVQRHIDLVLVHGDPRFVDLAESFPAAAELGQGRLGERVRYTGYVAEAAPPPSPERFDVIVSAGGGAVGEGLLRTALDARALLDQAAKAAGTPDAGRWLLIAGAMAPADSLARLAAYCGNQPRVALARHRDDFRAVLAAAGLSVSQAGYNTTMDVLATGVRAVMVPFAAPGETEQTARAEKLAALGRITLVPEAGLTAAALADAIRRAQAAPDPRAVPVDMDGAAKTAALLRAAEAVLGAGQILAPAPGGE